MPWFNFTLDGVSPHPKAVRRISVAYAPIRDTTEQRQTADGTTVARFQWVKQSITLTGSGSAPLVLPGVDYGAVLNLSLQGVVGQDEDGFPTWGPVSFQVRATPPTVNQTPGRREFSWTLQCIEQDAQQIHPLPFVFSLGGVTPHAYSQLDFNQSLNPLVGGNVVRMGSGAAKRRLHWQKTAIQLSGGGWVPLNGLDGLDYGDEAGLQLSISTLQSIDPQGNPVYQTTNYQVVTDGPSHDWDMVNRAYRWSLACEEI